MSELKWLKSSFSEASGNACVEIAATSHTHIAVRESDAPDEALQASQRALHALLSAAKSGQFGRP